MYEEMLTSTYSELRNKYPQFEDINTARKVITMKNGNNVPSISNYSDIILYYDIMTDSIPLLVVERVRRKDIGYWKLKKIVKELKKSIKGYYVSMNKSAINGCYDIVLLKSTVYENMKGER